MVVVSKDSLAKPGGQRFAMAILDVFYAINQRMADPKTADETLVAIGAKFSQLQLEEMKTIVQQTRFYQTPDEALKLLESEKFQNETMPQVPLFANRMALSTRNRLSAFPTPLAKSISISITSKSFATG